MQQRQEFADTDVPPDLDARITRLLALLKFRLRRNVVSNRHLLHILVARVHRLSFPIGSLCTTAAVAWYAVASIGIGIRTLVSSSVVVFLPTTTILAQEARTELRKAILGERGADAGHEFMVEVEVVEGE